MNEKRHPKRRRPDPIPPQEDLYADYYPEEEPDRGGAHLSPEDRERWYAERDAWYAERDAWYAQRDAWYAAREAELAEEEDEGYEDEEPAPPRRRSSRQDYAPEEEPPVRRPRRRRRRRHRVFRRLILLLLFVGLGLLLLGQPPVRNPEGLPRTPGRSAVLLAGTDQGGGRTDTIMLLSLERGGPVRLLSLPRDTYVPNYTSYKLNAVYGAAGGGEAGMELLLDETAKLLGFSPDGWVLVDLEVVSRAIDILGGVDYDVPRDMDYEDPDQDLSIHLGAGLQHLNGDQAVGLLRFRSGYATADIGRTAVQRDFLRAALGQWLRLENLGKLPRLLDLYRENVRSSLSFRNLMWIARVLFKADMGEMVTEVLPGWPDMAEGWAVYMTDPAIVRALAAAYSPYQ